MAGPCAAREREPTPIFEMMQPLGIEPGGDTLPLMGLVYLRAIRRCEGCESKKARVLSGFKGCRS